jgi:hypothetical protein
MNNDIYEAFTMLKAMKKSHKHFWELVDSIPVVDVIAITDTLTKTRVLPANDWLQSCSILHQYKTERFITDKQRRWCVMLVVTYWQMLVKLIEQQEFQNNLTSGFM